jgi:hypothetical protein
MWKYTYLLRIGGSRGIFVIIEKSDAACEEKFDLDNRGIVEGLIERARRGEVDGALSGAPCNTWSQARFRPGGRLRFEIGRTPGDVRVCLSANASIAICTRASCATGWISWKQ